MDFKQKTKDAYDKIALAYSKRNFDHFWIDEFEFFRSIIDGSKVIDLGCGAGRDASVFVEKGFDYTGIDFSEGMLSVARRRVPNGRFEQMDFSKMKFPDDTFDGFWAAASLLHIPKKEIDRVLQEVKRIVKSGGVGFISVREKTQIDEALVDEKKSGGISRYFAFYERNEFDKILQDNGFLVMKITTHTENDKRATNWLCYFVKNLS